jgi:hypothetical protein
VVVAGRSTSSSSEPPTKGSSARGLPARWPGNVLGQLVHLSTRELPGPSDAQAADVLRTSADATDDQGA